MDLMSRLSNTFWAEWFWLPKGYNWTVFASTADKIYPDFFWIYVPIPCSLLVLLVRFLFERYLIRKACLDILHVSYDTLYLSRNICDPIGRAMQIPERRARTPLPNQILEATYKMQKKVPDNSHMQVRF